MVRINRPEVSCLPICVVFRIRVDWTVTQIWSYGSIFWIIMFSRNRHYLISAEVWQGLGGNFLAPAERGSSSEEQRPARRSGAKSMSSRAPNYSKKCKHPTIPLVSISTVPSQCQVKHPTIPSSASNQLFLPKSVGPDVWSIYTITHAKCKHLALQSFWIVETRFVLSPTVDGV